MTLVALFQADTKLVDEAGHKKERKTKEARKGHLYKTLSSIINELSPM